MTDYDEEQEMEMEALESIYMEDFERVGDSPLCFSIKLVPNPGQDEDNHVGVTLKCTYTPTYPDDPCKLELQVDKGIKPAQLEELNTVMEDTATENAGMAYVFTVASAIKEWLDDNNEEPTDGSMYSEMMARMKAAEAEKAKAAAGASGDGDDDDVGSQAAGDGSSGSVKRTTGTAVTAATFAAWWAAFDAQRTAEGKAKSTTKKPTGRQLFETDSSLATSDADGGESPVAGPGGAGGGAGAGSADADTAGDGAGGGSGDGANTGAIDSSVFLEEDVDLSDLDVSD